MRDGFIYETADFPSCHASTLVETQPGKLLAAWFGGTDEGAKDVKIYTARHDGMGWSPPVVAAEEPGFPCWNPVLFKTKAGTLYLFYKAGPSPMTWSGYWCISKDHGVSWSKPEIMPAGLLGPIKNKPIQLADGTIVSGSSVESHRTWACWIERSTDDGRTWTKHGPIIVPGQPFGLIQPTLFVTADGRVVMLCRARGLGFVAQAESRDGGRTWEAARATTLPHPNSGIDLVKTGEGPIFLVLNATKVGRSPLNLARSSDDGQTWKVVHTLESEPGEFSYPAIIQGSDGRLHVTYTWKRRRIKYVSLDPLQFRS